MATLNFPDNPSTGDEYYDTNAGFNYEWNGVVWITKDLATPNNTREIDDISSGFDGSDTTFTLQVNGVNIAPLDVKQLVISVGGVMQNPGDDYTLSGSTLTFTNAPLAGLSFVGTFLGVAASLNTISAGSVSPSSLTTTSNYTVGSIKVSGASTIGNFVLTGLTTITDPDVTNLSSSGVGTVSNVILTGDNSGLGATIGAAVGVVTYYGDASNMTGVGLTMFPLSYGPGIGSTSIASNSDIVTTWNYPIQAGSGTITIRTGSGSGTIVDQFVVGSSSSITISGRSLTLNPADNLAALTEHFVVYPAGVIKSSSGQKENNQLVTSFTTKAQLKNLYAWGRNIYGSLGQNLGQGSNPGPGDRSSPVQIGTDTTWNNLYSQWLGSYHIFMGKEQGTLWALGKGTNAQLGLNDKADRSSPTQLPGTTWVDAQVTYNSSVALKSNGTLWSWGYNNKGQLGNNWEAGTGYFSSPCQIGTDTDWATTEGKLSGGQYSCRVIKANGTLWTWGSNSYGGLGQNNRTEYSSPRQVGTDTTWASMLGGGGKSTGAVKTDGTLWVWGESEYGQLGLNQGGSNAKKSSPTQVPGTTWSTWAGMNNAGIAIKTDGTMWAMGRNAYGALGDNTSVNRSSPTQVPGTTWSKVALSDYTTVASKTDGTYWTWGWSYQGSIGNNTTGSNAKYSSPVQIPGTWKDEVGGGNQAIFGIKLE